MHNSELTKRVITGILLGTVIVGALSSGLLPASALVLLIIGGSAFEFFRMSADGGRAVQVAYTILIVLPVMSAAVNLAPLSDPTLWLGMMSASLILVFLIEMRGQPEALTRRLQMLALAFVLFAIPGIFAIRIVRIDPVILLGIFILLWSSDVFAYFGGRLFGKNKMAPSISPKKTWEGFATGLFATGIAAWALGILLGRMPVLDWIVSGMCVVVFGTAGDFLQSAVKRTAGVKDSGNFLPGHGGMWDRFDSFVGCITWIGLWVIVFSEHFSF